MGISRSRQAVVVLVVASAGLCLGACSSHTASSATTSSSSSTTSTTSTTSTSSTPTSAPSSSSSTSEVTTTTESVCEKQATETYVHVIAAKETTDGGLNLSGNPTTFVCGGPDDYHFNVATTIEAVLVAPGATIEVLPLEENMHLEKIPASQLAGYLQTDSDTKIFLVTGPLDAATELQEQFHP
jgi:cytoskeletal protein RodZ